MRVGAAAVAAAQEAWGHAPAAGGRLGQGYALADGVLDPRTEDRPLDADLAAAADILGEISRL